MSHAPNPRGPDANYQERLTWDDVAWLKKTTRLPIGIKGIMTPRDAKRALDTGVELIWVSNHGGRQLDQTQGSIDALPPIVDAVAGQAAIVVDGGFNRGTDVIKALARGARVVACGRTMLWGLAADGADGVARVCEIMRDELQINMGLCGRTKISELTPDLIFRAD
jgi:isopentenyl diphosphate isomerase/L-lactate dehydrogenase-like FMN-dependent dehydrogenase